MPNIELLCAAGFHRHSIIGQKPFFTMLKQKLFINTKTLLSLGDRSSLNHKPQLYGKQCFNLEKVFKCTLILHDSFTSFEQLGFMMNLKIERLF